MENERLRKIAKKLGDAIARKRAERGLTQEEVAERLTRRFKAPTKQREVRIMAV